jgi:hypothetical protein
MEKESMSKVYLHRILLPDKQLGRVEQNGKVYRSDTGLDDRIGHVDLEKGKIYKSQPGPDEYIGHVDLDNGKVYRHVPAGRDDYLGHIESDGKMYQHEFLSPDDYMGNIKDHDSYAHAGAAFMLLVLPAFKEQTE